MHTRLVFFSDLLGPFINYFVSVGGRGGGQKLPILLSKKTTKRGGGGGQKLPLLRRHRLWTAPYIYVYCMTM